MGQSQSSTATIEAITNIMVNATASNVSTNSLVTGNTLYVNFTAVDHSEISDINIKQSQTINWKAVQESTNSVNTAMDIQNKIVGEISQKVMDWSVGQRQDASIDETIVNNVTTHFDISTVMQNAASSQNLAVMNFLALDHSKIDHVSVYQVGEVVFNAAQKCATSMVMDLKLKNDVHFKDVQDTKSGLGSVLSAAMTALIMPLIMLAIIVVLLVVLGGGIKAISGKMSKSKSAPESSLVESIDTDDGLRRFHEELDKS